MKCKRFLLSFVLVALIAVTALTGCSGNPTDPPDPSPAYTAESVIEIGQGETVFRFEVTDPDDNLTVWNVSTDEETVGAALLAVGLVDGEVGGFGLFITEVNGIVADFDADGAFWSFLIDGEFAMTGADATYIEPGVTYAFVYTQG